MRSDPGVRALVLGCVVGCAGAEASAPLAAPPAPIAVPEVEPQVATSAPPTGWPSATDGEASREATKARFDRLAAEREALDRAVERGAPDPSPGRCVTPDAARTGAAQADLRLEVRGPTTFVKGDVLQLSGSIHNVSRRKAHAIVLPGDGSDAGWRDPVISYTAFIDEGDGCWRPLERSVVARCGMFDADWTDEIVTVKASATRSLDPMWGFPAFEWRKGKVRLFVHYTWTGGTASKGGGATSIDPGAMAKERPYELVSNAVEVTVTG